MGPLRGDKNIHTFDCLKNIVRLFEKRVCLGRSLPVSEYLTMVPADGNRWILGIDFTSRFLMDVMNYSSMLILKLNYVGKMDDWRFRIVEEVSKKKSTLNFIKYID